MSPHAGTRLNSAGQKVWGLPEPQFASLHPTVHICPFLTFYNDLTAANTVVRKYDDFLSSVSPTGKLLIQKRGPKEPIFPRVFGSQLCTWSWHLQEKQLCETHTLACKVSTPTSGSLNGIDKQLSNWTKQVKNWLLEGEKQNKATTFVIRSIFSRNNPERVT